MKAGTTWVHDYLARAPECVSGYRKEYHVLDALDLPSQRWMRDRIATQAARASEDLLAGRAAKPHALHRAAMLTDPALYPAYFAGLLHAGGHRLTLDITPSYAMLGPERLEWVVREFARHRVRVVACFLMRDPVERIWSHVRMVKGRRPEAYPRSSEEHFLELYREPTFADRSRYEHTLASLQQAVDPADRFVGFYESLFTEDTTRALCATIGISAPPADFAATRNASPLPVETLADATARAAAAHFRGTYDAVRAACPEVDLAALWPRSAPA